MLTDDLAQIERALAATAAADRDLEFEVSRNNPTP
jgi:hypothetical protein